MITTEVAYLKNPWLRWFWEHGGEEPVGPLGPFVSPQVERAGPHPEPWRAAVVQLAQAAQVKDLASRLPEGRLKSAVAKSAEAAIGMVLDDWCGTPPRRHPWPWPGPPPWVWEIASELSLMANSLQAGSLRDGILDIAAQAVQKANTPA